MVSRGSGGAGRAAAALRRIPVCRLTRWFLDTFLKQEPHGAAALHASLVAPADDPTAFAIEHRPAVPLAPTARQLMLQALGDGADAAIALWERYGAAEKPLPLFHAGRQLPTEGHPTEALRLLEVSAERVPQRPAFCESLGDAYRATGERERAAETYEGAIHFYRHTESQYPEEVEWTIRQLIRHVEELRGPG